MVPIGAGAAVFMLPILPRRRRDAIHIRVFFSQLTSSILLGPLFRRAIVRYNRRWKNSLFEEGLT